jgi:hypothetical protein
MTERLRCLVPGCRRTRAACEFEEWICQRHWSLLGRRQRAAYARAKRRWRAGRCPGSVPSRIWRRLSRAVIEAAFLDPLA